MPTTEKQRRANRRNAQKSTGPKTKGGKKISSQNNVKDGLYAHDLILNSPALKESQEEYECMLTLLIDELQPEGIFQEYLVRKIANCLWRSRRVIRAETAQVSRQLETVDDDLALQARFAKLMGKGDSDAESPEEKRRARAIAIGLQSIPNDNASHRLLRYEMRLDRQLTRTLTLLTRLKRFPVACPCDIRVPQISTSVASAFPPNVNVGQAQTDPFDIETLGPIKNDETNPISPGPDDHI